MKRNSRNLTDIAIDLTSLLDVVFILLMVVLLNGQLTSEKLEDKSAELDTRIEEAAEARQDAEDMARLYSEGLNTIEGSGENILSVYASYDPSMITRRHLRVLAMDEEIQEFDLVGSDVSGSFSDFRSYILGYIEDHTGMPVIISLNKNDEYILYRDECSLIEILNDIADQYPDVYLR